MTDRIARDRIEDAAFKVWQDIRAADFDLLMANRHGYATDLAKVRKALTEAIERIDAALEAAKSAGADDPTIIAIRGPK